MALKRILLALPPKCWDFRYQALLDRASFLLQQYDVCHPMIKDFYDPCVCQLNISQVFLYQLGLPWI